LATLAKLYLSQPDAWGTPWLSSHEKLVRLQTTLSAVEMAPGVEPAGVKAELSLYLGNELDLDQIITWQFPLFERIFSPLIVQRFTQLGLIFYQAGQFDRASRLLERVVALSEQRKDAASELGPTAITLDRELSKAHQYLAITHDRQGQIEKA